MKTIYQEYSDSPIYYRESYHSGGSWHSYENGVRHGDVREINDILCKAWQIRPRLFRSPEILWVSLRPESLRKVDINEKP